MSALKNILKEEIRKILKEEDSYEEVGGEFMSRMPSSTNPGGNKIVDSSAFLNYPKLPEKLKTLYNKLPPNPSSINPENHFYLPDLPSWVTFNDAGEYEDGGLQNISVKIRSKKEADNWAKDKKTLSRELKLSPRDEKTYEF